MRTADFGLFLPKSATVSVPRHHQPGSLLTLDHSGTGNRRSRMRSTAHQASLAAAGFAAPAQPPAPPVAPPAAAATTRLIKRASYWSIFTQLYDENGSVDESPTEKQEDEEGEKEEKEKEEEKEEDLGCQYP